MFDKTNINKRIWINTFAQFGSKFLSVLLSLLTVALLSRHLGAEGYGNFSLVFTYISFFSVFSDLGFNQVVVREFSYENEKPSDVKASFFNIKLLLNLMSILLPLLTLPLFPYSESLKLAIIVGVFAVAVGNMVSYSSAILQSQLRLDIVALLDLSIKIASVLLIYWLTKINAGLYPMIGAILFGNSFGFCISYLFVRKQIKIRFHIDLLLAKRLLKLGIPIGISSFLALLYFKVDTLMLSIIRSPIEVGIYGLAYKVLENILMLWGLYMASIFPLLTKFYGRSDPLKYQTLLRNTIFVLIVLTLIFVIIGFTFSPTIMRILGGDKFNASILPFRILVIAIPFFFLNNVIYNVILSFGKTKYLILPLVSSFLINFLFNLYAIPRYGYLGAGVTTVITATLTSIIYILFLFKNFKREVFYWKIYL